MTRASTAATPPTMVARSIVNAHALRGLAQRSWASEVILPDTRPDRGSGWSFRRSGRYGRRSVKPPADPTLVRTQHLPLLLARGSRRDQDHPVRSNAEAQSPAGAAQPAHRCPSLLWLLPAWVSGSNPGSVRCPGVLGSGYVHVPVTDHATSPPLPGKR